MPGHAPQLRPPLSRATAPATLVVTGGRLGVGATTLAVNLAAFFAQDAHRIVLIDADLDRADVAAQCNLSSGLGIGDVLAGHKSIHEVLQRGPAGMHVLAGSAAAVEHTTLSERSVERLIKQMASLSPYADSLLVDAGNQPRELTARLWSVADSLVLVTSPDAVAVMDTYALVKTLLSRHSLRPRLMLVVNQADDDAVAADVHRRIDQSCRRFLGLKVGFAGWLPHDRAVGRREFTGSLAGSFSRLARQVLEPEPPSRQQRLAA
jgi:flagellar biosynthesis protein FlhG